MKIQKPERVSEEKQEPHKNHHQKGQQSKENNEQGNTFRRHLQEKHEENKSGRSSKDEKKKNLSPESTKREVLSKNFAKKDEGKDPSLGYLKKGKEEHFSTQRLSKKMIEEVIPLGEKIGTANEVEAMKILARKRSLEQRRGQRDKQNMMAAYDREAYDQGR